MTRQMDTREKRIYPGGELGEGARVEKQTRKTQGHATLGSFMNIYNYTYSQNTSLRQKKQKESF